MNNLFAMLASIFNRYTMGQRVVLVTVLTGMLSAVIALVIWANQPEYDTLYANLEPAVAGQIVSELRAQKVNFKIEDNGRTVLVPRDQVAELRLSLAEQGFASDKVTGYEIFDDAKIGMTTFMQRLNMRRALEGELVKTINQFPEVKNSRVHLVLPEEELFESERKGSASVVLYLVPGRFINDEQVKGITALVANSVKGIEADNVVIVDSDGNLLTSSADDQAGGGMAGNQYDVLHKEEMKYQKKVTDIVESIVGVNNAIVRVSIDMNFEKVERTSETPDPETVVVVSEESRSEKMTTYDSTRMANEEHANENILTNYEIGKIREHYVGNSGTVTRLSIAVLVNGTYKTTTDANGVKTKEYVARNRRDLDQIAALVRSAVGYDVNRGDIVEVQNMSFDRSSLDDDQEYFAEMEKKQMLSEVINKGVIAVGVIIAFLMLRSLLKSSGSINLPVSGGSSGRAVLTGGATLSGELPSGDKAKKQLAIPEESEEDYIPEDIFIKKLSPEARAKLKANDKMMSSVTTYAKDDPEGAAKIVRSWLTRDASGANR